jgi:hypothetical protein
MEDDFLTALWAPYEKETFFEKEEIANKFLAGAIVFLAVAIIISLVTGKASDTIGPITF